MESPMQETIYGTNSDDSHVMSEKVQSLASNIYQELERMIEKYDEDVVKELMPLVVNVLESLDSAVMDNQEHEVELELLREDNEQLVTQYEREKQLRKSAEQRLLEIEYSTDDDRRNLLAKVESLESIVRMLELKAKNSSDHASRLEEKDSEMKKEYAILHERYTELFKTHMDYMERTKILFGPDKLEVLNTKTRPLHFPHTKSNITSFVSPQEVGSNILSSPADVPSLVSPNQSSDSNASLKSEIQEVAYSTVATSPRRKSGSKGKEKSVTEKGQITDRITLSDRSTGTRDGWVDDLDVNLNDALVTTPEMDEIEEMDGYNFDLDNSTMKRPNTLYEELSFQDNDALGDLEEGADISGGYARRRDYASSESDGESEREHKVNDSIFGMGKEVENLISENNELLATKNALNVVKDDLIAKVDELTSEQEILREELKQYMSVKEKLKQRISELEEELKKAKEAAEKSKSGKSDDEEELPMAQRKRFTRVEMARVLMERNQYKERLMELQEAVRWTEMIRASRSDSSLDTKRNKSSIWKFFSNLFNANEKPPRKSMPFVNVHYNAPTTSSGPALDTMRKKRLGDRHRGLDILDSDLVSEKLQQQRARERREQYKQVRAHVRKEDGRLQAYGWSLPSRTSSTVKNTETETATQAKTHNSSVPVPVPVFCRPLLEKEIGMKVWCAAGVDLTGGKPESSNVSVVGSSLFYVTSADEVTKLNDELKEYEKHRKEQMLMERNLSSYVWLCTSTHTTSKVTVIDANNPAEILDSFQVCSSHLLCIASIPGTKSSDYPVDEEFLKMGKRESSMDCSDTEPGKAGDLLYISIAAETACDSSASTPVNKDSSIESAQNNVIEETKYIDEDSNRISSSFAQNSKDDLPSSHPLSESFENVSSSPDKPNHDIQQTEKMSSVLPTMWLGSQGGHIYVHSSVAQWWCCINSVKLRDSVLSIVHMRGRVFAGLADGSVAIFHRGSDGEWDLLNFHLLDLGRPLYSVRCMTIVDKYVWCGYRNCIHVVDTESLAVVETFDAHPRKESQVRQMAWIEDGVWVTIRLDSTLRLYHAHTRQHLQDVDIEPYVSKMLGTGKLGFSFVRITALLISCKRLWMGTGNGVIISVPLTEEKVQCASSDSSGRAPGSVVRVYSDIGDSLHKSGFIPYCSMAQAQLSFHGHRDAVKFFVAVPGFAASSKIGSDQDGKDMQSEIKQAVSRNKETGQKPDCMLILSGGEGYIDFRIGDGEEDETLASLTPDSDERRPVALVKGDRSHLIVWQVALAD
ncbi:C-Jun-amino-terminal kinase-interacting protein 4-like isoform X2 [Stegodyphus dumicola]|uniref:C-Jun-amino-terminal kinase-interacting protein 4-like isoform X2 n=1 Tax=Stegodyphus dumicola TaxID=202533 RepID=UPI0015AF3E6B|nr:C-Jun-amino-terminal kinase-interacting protein 4-like isoform X2 [Stegodyphus dumicola]